MLVLGRESSDSAGGDGVGADRPGGGGVAGGQAGFRPGEHRGGVPVDVSGDGIGEAGVRERRRRGWRCWPQPVRVALVTVMLAVALWPAAVVDAKVRGGEGGGDRAPRCQR